MSTSLAWASVSICQTYFAPKRGWGKLVPCTFTLHLYMPQNQNENTVIFFEVMPPQAPSWLFRGQKKRKFLRENGSVWKGRNPKLRFLVERPFFFTLISTLASCERSYPTDLTTPDRLPFAIAAQRQWRFSGDYFWKSAIFLMGRHLGTISRSNTPQNKPVAGCLLPGGHFWRDKRRPSFILFLEVSLCSSMSRTNTFDSLDPSPNVTCLN